MLKRIFICCFYILAFKVVAIEALLEVNKKEILIGEPLVINVTFKNTKAMKTLPTHKLFLNGKEVIKINPLSLYYLGEFVIKNNSISYNLLFLIDNKKEFFFNKQGESSIILEYKKQKVIKTFKVLPVPMSEQKAFSSYQKIKPYIFSFLSWEFDQSTFTYADIFLKKYPNSIYSKEPLLYFTSMGNYIAKKQAMKKLKLKVGDKVDIERFRKIEIAFYNKNIELLKVKKYPKGFLKNHKMLSIIINKLGVIISKQKMPSKHTIEILKKQLLVIINNSSFKPHITQASLLLDNIKELEN